MQDSRLFYSHPATSIKRRVIGATGRRTYNANSTLSGELRKPNLKHTIRRSSRVRIASHLGPRLTTFRINTCQSVSKQSTLTTFRINTCEKPRGRGPRPFLECGGLVHPVYPELRSLEGPPLLRPKPHHRRQTRPSRRVAQPRPATNKQNVTFCPRDCLVRTLRRVKNGKGQAKRLPLFL